MDIALDVEDGCFKFVAYVANEFSSELLLIFQALYLVPLLVGPCDHIPVHTINHAIVLADVFFQILLGRPLAVHRLVDHADLLIDEVVDDIHDAQIDCQGEQNKKPSRPRNEHKR